LKPVQPFFLVNTRKYYKIKAPSMPIVHFYSFTADAENARHSRAVPDGCVDLMFTTRGGAAEGWLCGMVTRNDGLVLPRGSECFGVRFRPGYLPERFDAAIPELLNNRVPVGALPGGAELLSRVAETDGFYARTKLLRGFFGDGWRRHELLQLLIARIDERGGAVRVAELEAETLYSARYINKVFTSQLGVPPKTFAKYVRFQNLIGRLNSGKPTRLCDAALDFGYYDQPHLIKEFKEFASITPREYKDAVDLPHYYQKIVYI
jgi:AraC-like DNA-binding protein